MKKKPIVARVAWLGLALATAAAAPHDPRGADIYLAEIHHGTGGAVQLENLVNVTDRKGYDNHPAFSADGKLLYYTAWSDGQADTWILDISSKSRRVLRATREMEFSPTLIPGGDALAVVRTDGVKYEVWRYPLNGGEPSVLLPDFDQAGEFAWIDADHLVIHELGRPPKMRKMKVGPGKGDVLASFVGRTVQSVPGTNDVLFVQRGEDGSSQIQRLDASGKVETLIETLPKHEDFAVSADGTLWTSDGKAVFMAAPGAKAWTKVADVSEQVADEISRLAVSPDGTLLALVSDEWVF